MPEKIKLIDVLNRGLGAGVGGLVHEPAEEDGKGQADRLRKLVLGAERSEDLAGFFEAASIAADPPAAAAAFIEAKYSVLGGSSGLLGPPTGAVLPCPDGAGYHRHFRSGSIYWRPETGAHVVHGPIRARWAALGWERSVLGYPTGDVEPGVDPGQRGLQCHFQGGMILWHPPAAGAARAAAEDIRFAFARPKFSGKGLGAAAFEDLVVAVETDSAEGAYEVHGAIAAHYRALGGSASILGYPVTDETGTPDGVGRFNHFEAGSIYWTPTTGAHEVHGLMRQFWADHGWERNPSLGYPIEDELIPDRRIGHRHPERLRKPVADLPVDLIKLPKEATQSGFSRLIANLSASGRFIRGVAGDATPALSPIERGIESPTVEIAADFDSSPAPEQSQNRFGDFENGVLFWRRGAVAAQQLQPWTRSTAGESMTRSAAEVLEALRPRLGDALDDLPGGAPAGFSFAGTTAYSWDGVGVRNRRHRVLAQLTPPLGLELELEASFEPLKRFVSVALVDWRLPAASMFGSGPLTRALHERLDGLLFEKVTLIDLPDTDGGRPLAVLSAKTMPDGTVAVFVEPNSKLAEGFGQRNPFVLGGVRISGPIDE